MEQLALSWEPERRLFTVAGLNAAIRGWLESEFGDVWVAGEISGVKLASSGHYYFTLKDQEAQLRCVCFRNSARYLKFKPQDGIAVLAHGHIDVYEPRGEYQLQVDALEPQGHGALQLAFEQLKKKLAAEGLFAPERKRPLPKLPRRIGIVTSPSGAAVRDMIQILDRRFPGLNIRLYPAQVQGEGSVAAVCEGLDYFSRSGWAEVVIVGRGGGSLEDLWTFNEEPVARAIGACSVPVISAVGHETDFSISDFVADVRAPTPSAAAELAICTRDEILEKANAAAHKMQQSIRYRFAQARRRLQEQGIDRAVTLLHRRIGRHLQWVDEIDYRFRDQTRLAVETKRRVLLSLEARLRKTDLRLRFSVLRRRLESAGTRAAGIMRTRTADAHRRLDPLAAKLAPLSPLNILERGYAIVETETGNILRDATEAPVKSAIRVRLAKGRLQARVTKSEKE